MGKKICFFIGSVSGKGGTERVCIGLANKLAEEGYHVTILSLYEGKTPFFSIHPTITLVEIFEHNQSFTKLFLKAVFRLKKIIQDHHYDIFVSVETILCMYSVPAVKLSPSVKHLAWEHFNLEVNFGLKVRKWARWMAAKYCHKIVVLTKRDQQLWERKFTFCSNIVCIPNSAAVTDIPVSAYEKREKLVIAVGRLTYQKGFDMLIQSWAMIANRFPDWKLNIIGSGEDEMMLKHHLSNLSLNGSVKIEPATTQITQYYNKASIYCASSRFEGLPMVLIEAQQFGLPIVSFDCNTGPAEVVTDGVNGLLCTPNSELELANALAQCMMDDEKRIGYHQAALLSAKRFDEKTIYLNWINLLNSLTN